MTNKIMYDEKSSTLRIFPKEDSVQGTREGSFCTVLQHAKPCPASLVDDGVLECLCKESESIRVAVSVMLEDSARRILLTRRSSSMRTYPGAWVLPGGHVDLGEELFDTAAREVKEEVGISLDKSSLRILGLFEATFCGDLGTWPPRPGSGLRRHYLVVYMVATLMTEKPVLTMEPSEVDACTWIDPSVVRALCTSNARAPEVGRGHNELRCLLT
uniref:Nudix hydrolase domain-containing protein n=1 Tax=Hanusia phi TaxID=3032 RepID=A0A7S0I2Q1_9CRYP|mmetsp:Transcript_8722/g.19781  ORF Transcript_8722/g.19781 Transcript_8722/m.19781 type:complete len:215 (+) Transcript_8722:232-876(+)